MSDKNRYYEIDVTDEIQRLARIGATVTRATLLIPVGHKGRIQIFLKRAHLGSPRLTIRRIGKRWKP